MSAETRITDPATDPAYRRPEENIADIINAQLCGMHHIPIKDCGNLVVRENPKLIDPTIVKRQVGLATVEGTLAGQRVNVELAYLADTWRILEIRRAN